MDSTIFNEVKIGKQVWMAENLNVATFRNGDPIPEAKTEEEWKKAGKNRQPAWCYYENRAVQDDPIYGENYGKLYNWYAVNDPRGLAPKGWHIPTDDEWTVLTNFLGEEAGYKMYKKGYNRVDFKEGINESGFNGLMCGYRSSDGPFYNIGEFGFWWSSAENDAFYAWFRKLYFKFGIIGRDYKGKGEGVSVRCLRD